MRPGDKWNAGSCDELGVNLKVDELGVNLKVWEAWPRKISDPQDISTNSSKYQERQVYFMKCHALENKTP